MKKHIALVVVLSACASCDVADPVADVQSRSVLFPDYPVAGTTYLSFSRAHGYQVNFIAPNGKAWLWYPGNRGVVPEEWTRETLAGHEVLCWRHPERSYNPVSQTFGGSYACQSLLLSRKSIVSALPGDPFTLASGRIPHVLNRCVAPEAFAFDRMRYGC